jgi:ABC-type uncharacterized transport system permease subunit
MTANLFLPVSVAGYVVTVITATLRTVYRVEAARRATSVLLVVTWFAHLGAVVQQGLRIGGLPLTTGAEYLLVLGWIVLSLHLLLWFRAHIDVSGLVLPPLAGALCFVAMQRLGVRPARPDAPDDGWFFLHITISTLGMATLCVTFAMSVLYLVQDRALKAKRTRALLGRLPSLERTDRLGHRALVVGFVLLTIGIAAGIVVTAEEHEPIVLGAKQILPVLAWLIFAVVLGARAALGLRGRKSAYLTIAGFVLGLATVIGMTR